MTETYNLIHHNFFYLPVITSICPRTFSSRVWQSLLTACRKYVQWHISYLSSVTLIGCGSSFMTFLDHTQRHTTVGRTPMDEWSARRIDLYLTTTHNTYNRQTSMPPVGLFFYPHTFIQVPCVHSSTYVTATVSINPAVRMLIAQGTLSLPTPLCLSVQHSLVHLMCGWPCIVIQCG